jgi:hypothetical protein
VFAEDLSPFFSTDGFAIAATLGAAAVTGVFEAGFQDAPLDGFGPASSSPTFTLPSANVPANPLGLALVVASGFAAGTYRVANARHDGTGVCTLDLLTQRP